MGKFRKQYLYGWSLYRFYDTLSRKPELFSPAPIFEAMKKVPPPQGPFLSKKKGEIKFPDDNLRIQLEKNSQAARELARHGMTPTPWWFERRPIDEAVLKVKEIMIKDPSLTQAQAIKMWEDEHKLRLQLQQREVQLVTEESLKRAQSASQASTASGVISAHDSIQVLKLMRDMQAESNYKYHVSLEELAARASEKMSVSKDRSKPPGLNDEQTNLFMSEFNQMVEERFKSHREKGEALAKYEPMTNLQVEQLKSLQLDQRLHPTVLRKIAVAHEIQAIVLDIVTLKQAGQITTFSQPQSGIMSVFDFLAAYLRTRDQESMNMTHIEAESFEGIYFKKSQLTSDISRSLFGEEEAENEENEEELDEDEEGSYSSFKESVSDAEVQLLRSRDKSMHGPHLYIQLHRQFQAACNSFLNMSQVEMNVSGILAGLDLGFGNTSPQTFVDMGPYPDPLAEASLPKIDIEPIVSALKQKNVYDFERLSVFAPNELNASTYEKLKNFMDNTISTAKTHNDEAFELLQKDKAKIEELFYLLPVKYILRVGTLEPYKRSDVFILDNQPQTPKQDLAYLTEVETVTHPQFNVSYLNKMGYEAVKQSMLNNPNLQGKNLNEVAAIFDKTSNLTPEDENLMLESFKQHLTEAVNQDAELDADTKSSILKQLEDKNYVSQLADDYMNEMMLGRGDEHDEGEADDLDAGMVNTIEEFEAALKRDTEKEAKHAADIQNQRWATEKETKLKETFGKKQTQQQMSNRTADIFKTLFELDSNSKKQ